MGKPRAYATIVSVGREGGGSLTLAEDYRRGKPRAYATSVFAGRGGGGGRPNIFEGDNPGPTPPAYQLVGEM